MYMQYKCDIKRQDMIIIANPFQKSAISKSRITFVGTYR